MFTFHDYESDLCHGYNVLIHIDGIWQVTCCYNTQKEAEEQIKSYIEDDRKEGDDFEYKIVPKNAE